MAMLHPCLIRQHERWTGSADLGATSGRQPVSEHMERRLAADCDITQTVVAVPCLRVRRVSCRSCCSIRSIWTRADV